MSFRVIFVFASYTDATAFHQSGSCFCVASSLSLDQTVVLILEARYGGKGEQQRHHLLPASLRNSVSPLRVHFLQQRKIKDPKDLIALEATAEIAVVLFLVWGSMAKSLGPFRTRAECSLCRFRDHSLYS